MFLYNLYPCHVDNPCIIYIHFIAIDIVLIVAIIAEIYKIFFPLVQVYDVLCFKTFTITDF